MDTASGRRPNRKPSRSAQDDAPKAGDGPGPKANRRLLQLSLAALGVVFGDIATSPIYAIRECFYGDYGIEVSHFNIMGIISLVFWSLLIVVGLKYLIFVFRADNRGEGGVLALTALARQQGDSSRRRRGIGIIGLGLFAACLLYGDGMITPAISVLSAVEGLRIVTPALKPYILPLTIIILCGLFLIQRSGTARVGGLFGPIIMVWLIFLAITGVAQIIRSPQILAAVFPWHGIEFLLLNKAKGFLVLGAVFLVVTGTEALYADIGHFGVRPIRLTWFVLVFPALLLNYFGQGAMLLMRPEEAHHPFYAMVPSWATVPTVVLATLATIIASQAVISGAFSLTHQAIQLGFLPRLRIRHTSAAQMGQIYVGPVNWMLMLCTIALVVGFQSSSRLAAAYGVAVTSTMLITTTLFYRVSRHLWHWPLYSAVLLTGFFYVVDVTFFSANITKILHGAWFPLAIGGVFYTLMITWARGREILVDQLRRMMPPMRAFISSLSVVTASRIDSQAVFLTGNPHIVPVALAKNVKHNRIIHRRTVLLHFRVEEVPRVPNLNKVKVEKLGRGFYRMTLRFGFMEEAQLETAFALAREQGLDLDLKQITYYIGREKLIVGASGAMARWRANLFIFMSRNATDAASFFNLPPGQVVEIGVRLEL